MHSSAQREAFTLVELLVVIAIIVLLAALLFPVLSSGRERGRAAACLSNVKQINMALLLYINDYDEWMPANVSIPAINGGDFPNQPYDRQLSPYVKNDQAYTCPSDSAPRGGKLFFWDGNDRKKNLRRSYSICASITTQQSTDQGKKADPNTGVDGHPLAHFDQPAETISVVENWATAGEQAQVCDNLIGSLNGARIEDCDTWKLAGRVKPSEAPIDNFAPCKDFYSLSIFTASRGHFDHGNYAFVDGHVKALRWPQVRTNDFRIFKVSKPQQTFSP